MGLVDYVQEYSQQNVTEVCYDIPDNILAIKEMTLYKCDGGNEPKYVKLQFEMPHYMGWFATQLPSKEFWDDSENTA